MRESVRFTYDGISSEDMGVIAASPDGGLFEESFMATRSLVETKIPNNPKPYLQRVESEPLSFPFSFYIEEWVPRENHREIARWLFQPSYKPMTFETHPNRVVYALFEGDTNIRHNGMDGYVTTNVRTNSPWVYSFPIETDTVTVTTTKSEFILNSGDNPIKPKMWIKKKGAGKVVIINNTNGQRVEVDKLQDGEEVYFNFAREEIVSSLQKDLQIYRYNDHNDVWLQFETEENDLTYEGNFEVKFEYQLEYMNFWGD